MNRKLNSVLALALAGSLALLSGCGQAASSSEGASSAAASGDTLLNLYTWEGMFPQEVLDGFTAETGIQINYSSFDTDETMLAKLEAAKGGDYDLVIADDYIVETAISEGLVAKLDKTKLSNLGNVNPIYQGQFFDPEDAYTVPYGAGVQTIVYDPALVEKPITCYADLWDESLKDNLAVIGNYRVVDGMALKVLGDRAIAVIPPNCMSTVAFIYPHMSLFTNGMIPPFAGTAAVMSGILAGAKAQGLEDYHVVGFAGDGGTADIGLQALSGMIDRNDKAIFICYDNEAYMNTGVQKSGLTPYGMKTTNTPSGSRIHGSQSSKKRMFEIVAAHGIPYAATASLGYPEDYLAKVEKAMNTDGTSYIHVMAPCPTGWGTASDVTVDIGKEAVDCGLWYLAEFENGKFTVNRDPKEFSSVEDYLKKQSRFTNLDDHDLERIIAERDATWQRIRNDWVK